MIWFFRNCKKCVDTPCCCSSIHSSSKSNRGSLRQRRWLKAHKFWLSLLFTIFSTSKVSNFNCVLLCVANPSRASTNDSTKIPDWNCIKRMVVQANWTKLIQIMERAHRSNLQYPYRAICLTAYKLIQNQIFPCSQRAFGHQSKRYWSSSYCQILFLAVDTHSLAKHVYLFLCK